MGGRRTTRDELAQLEVLTKEGLPAREIAQKLDRSPAAIRNLRYENSWLSEHKTRPKLCFNKETI
jgi:hypothetical protein